MNHRLHIFSAASRQAMSQGLTATIPAHYADRLPADRGARVLLKPNLNSNMNALTGNTTDLRLLAAVIRFLKDQGYHDITIGEGTNSGFYRNRISVISRLKVDELARHFGVEVKDLNYSEPVEVEFEDGLRAGVAREVVEAELLINLPKLKTHFENGMSVCLKNLMGTLVGQANKKKTHQSLAKNILNINKLARPHLHIVDAVIAMEGLGPSRGEPVETGMVIVGDDPFLIDLMCTRIATFDYRKVRTLAAAEQLGLIGPSHHRFVADYPLERVFEFKPPQAGPIATFIHHPSRQKYFLAVRNTPFFDKLCSTKFFGHLLFLTGLRQDVFMDEDDAVERLMLDPRACTECGICAAYCPVDLPLPQGFNRDMSECIDCLYCYCVCPEKALSVEGKLGFFQEQIRQYDGLVRKPRGSRL